MLRSLFLGLSLLMFTLRVSAAEPVTVVEGKGEWVIGNGLVTLTLGKRGGSASSIKFRHNGRDVELGGGRNALYFDAGGGKAYPVSGADGQIVRQDPEAVEVVWKGKPTGDFPFAAEMHCLVPRSESGFYLYAVYRHGPGMAAGGVGEARFVIKGAPDTEIFTHHVVDDGRKGPYPISKNVSEVQDATFLLEDGTIYTKYDNSSYLARHYLHGMAGHGLGIWMMFPSYEFIGGGPFKQELTVHKGNTLLAMFVGGHFGSGGLSFQENEPWTKVYGPFFVYCNAGATVDALWEDAKLRAAQEVAKWPYAWLKSPDYPLDRGTVSGRVRLSDGASAAGAWAVLAPVGEDWCQLLKGYDFWDRVDERNEFVMPKVRPGRYALTLVGGNQFEELRRENIDIRPGANDLGEIVWPVVQHGKTLWQIGIADRVPHEFKGGNNYRHFGNFLRYRTEFPDDVTFTIGKSKAAEDWNFAQWSLYNKRPFWTIRFDQPQPAQGRATLTLGMASTIPPSGRGGLVVKVNGQPLAPVKLKKSGTAAYRSGSSDSVYNVATLPFDAKLLRAGANEITLAHSEAKPFPPAPERPNVPGAVMYDAVRLELDPSTSPP